MPKTLIACHLVLLACLSLLVFPSVAARVAGDPGPIPAGPVAQGVAIAAAALAVVMFFTEVFSGLRWIAVAAAVGSLVGLIGLSEHVSPVSLWAWAIGWAAVALWFAVLASQRRRDR